VSDAFWHQPGGWGTHVRLTLACTSATEKLLARVGGPPSTRLPVTPLGVRLPPMTPNMPAGEPLPESGCDPDPPNCGGAGDRSPAGCDAARDLLNGLGPSVAARVGDGRYGGCGGCADMARGAEVWGDAIAGARVCTVVDKIRPGGGGWVLGSLVGFVSSWSTNLRSRQSM
jgi:hypothetical protein